MIIQDYSAIAIAAIFSQDRPEEIEEGLIRHMILNSIRRYNLQFREEYGETIIACDHRSWRKDSYPQYKANRKKNRDESPLDWGKFFELISMVRDELAEVMPYRVMHVENAEADDIIGHLVESTQEFGKNEPVMIISSDKDFLQLQRYKNVNQFSPMKRDFVKIDDPFFYLFEHICKGDTGDGVPNVLSPDDTFVNGDRQRPLRAAKISSWYESFNKGMLENDMDAESYRNFCRNKRMIDLSYTPKDIRENINRIYNEQGNKGNDKVFGYLVEKRCNMLISSVQDFFVNHA